MTTNLTLAEAVKQYIAVRRARREIVEASARCINECLLVFVRYIGHDRALHDIGRHDIEKWIGSMGCSDSTLRLRLSAVRGFFQWNVLEENIERDPTLGLKGPKKPRRVARTIGRDATDRIIAGALDTREKLILMLMLTQGLRSMEAAALEIADIDLSERLMLVRGKGGHQRVLPITGALLAVLTEYLKERGTKTGPLLLAQGRGRRGGRPGKQRPACSPNVTYKAPDEGLTASWISKQATKAIKRAGVSESAHALRHTFARRMVDNGAPMMAVRDALGHVSIATTEIYVGFSAAAEMRTYMDREEDEAAS